MPTLDLSEQILNVIKSVFKDFKFGCFIVSSIFTGIVDFPVHLKIISRREFLTINDLSSAVLQLLLFYFSNIRHIFQFWHNVSGRGEVRHWNITLG